jgi:hypothetical protein
MTTRISPEGRTALRRAITNHVRWNDYRKANNLSLATMGRDDYLSTAANLGLNVQEIIDNANNEARDNSPKTEKAREVFNTEPAPHAPQVSTPNLRDLGIEQNPEQQIRRAKAQELATPEPVKMNGTAHREIPTDAAGKLMALIAEIAGTSVNADEVKAIVKAELATALTSLIPTVRIELKKTDGTVTELEGHKHPEFPALLRAATARDANGFVVNCWLAGPAGSGKTYAASQVAKALGLAFHYNGAISMAHELLGFTDANGIYHRTPFRDAYENGGVYLFDEVDGSDNAALLALNAALANGTASFPDGQVTRHKDCIIFAAANTWGLGGTSDYVGRAKIDAAFLSRFPARFNWQYDEALERSICGNDNFARRVQRARKAAKDAGLKVLITPRDSIAGAALIAAGFSETEAAERTYLASLSPEQKRMLNAA